MSDVPQWALDALSDVSDPCCRVKGIAVVDMGLVRSVRAVGDQVRVELLLTSGWCPFAARVLTEIAERIEAQPGVRSADVEIVWDEAWTTDRLSPRAASLLRFLPPPAQVPDRGAFIAARQPALGTGPLKSEVIRHDR